MFCSGNNGSIPSGDIIHQLRSIVTKTNKHKIISSSASHNIRASLTDVSSLSNVAVAVPIAVGSSSNQNNINNNNNQDDDELYEVITDEITIAGQKNLVQKVKIRLGDYKVPWTLDSEASSCMRCNRGFGVFFKRRHHCRLCGYCVCSSCSSTRLALKFLYEDGGSRVCRDCYDNQASSILPPQSCTPVAVFNGCFHEMSVENNPKYAVLNSLDNESLSILAKKSMSYAQMIVDENGKRLSLSSPQQNQQPPINSLAQGVIDSMDTLKHQLILQHESILSYPFPLLGDKSPQEYVDYLKNLETYVTPNTRRQMIESILQNNGVWEEISSPSSEDKENCRSNNVAIKNCTSVYDTPQFKVGTGCGLNNIVWESDSDATMSPRSVSPKIISSSGSSRLYNNGSSRCR